MASKEAPKSDVDKVADAGAFKDAGNAYFKRGEHFQAFEAYGKALELHPEDGTVWLNRSIAARLLERWDDSLENASKAVELAPSNVKAYYGKAYALHKLGNTMKALEAITIGQVQQPDNKALKDLEVEIMKMNPEMLKMYLQAGIAGDHLKDLKADKPKTKPKATSNADAKSKAQVRSGGYAAQSTLQYIDPCPATKIAGTDAEVKAKIKQAKGTVYEWKDRNPSKDERECFKFQLVSMFREKYIDLKAQMETHKAKKKSALNVDQYAKEQQMGLQLKGGHRPMDRPEGIDVPDAYGSPVGTLTQERMSGYGADNAEGRLLVSVYGDIFDVSDRPDKYGSEGPYRELCGKDLTWGLFSGNDTPEMCNRYYDLFKAKDAGVDKLAGVCSWLAWYETEYGKPVGRVSEYNDEPKLPMPPLEEIEACVVM